MKLIKIILIAALSISLMNIVGCSSLQVALEHKNLEVSSQQKGDSIILPPVPDNLKKVYISIKNTSDKEISITSKVAKAIKSHGYKIMRNPSNAHYLLQANILSVGKMSQSAANNALRGGFGSGLTGLVSGAALGSLTSSSTNTIVGAGLIGGLLNVSMGSLVKDVNFSMISDVQISERVNGIIKESTKANIKNGSSTQTNQVSSRKTNFQKYRIRVLSNADKVNLKFAEARPALEQSLAKVISGVF